MTETTDIEKKSLEAHVELCAERYRFLEEKLETLEGNISSVKAMVVEVHNMIQTMSTKRNDQLINWGIGIMSIMTGIIGWLVVHYVIK
jgi:prefoldin subunit 5